MKTLLVITLPFAFAGCSLSSLYPPMGATFGAAGGAVVTGGNPVGAGVGAVGLVGAQRAVDRLVQTPSASVAQGGAGSEGPWCSCWPSLSCGYGARTWGGGGRIGVDRLWEGRGREGTGREAPWSAPKGRVFKIINTNVIVSQPLVRRLAARL